MKQYMKKFISIFLVSFALLPVSFANETPNWDEMILIANYDSSAEEILLHFEVNNVDFVNTDYYLNLYLGGEKYRKSFLYSDAKNAIEVDFQIDDSSGLTQYPISVRIQNGRLSEVFSSDAVINFPEGETVPDSVNTMTNINNAANVNILDLYYRNSAIPTNNSAWPIPQNTSSGVPVIISTDTSNNNTVLPTVIETPITPVVVPSLPRYTPKYPTRASEPKTINGIGNSQSYSSWRVR